LLLEIFFPSLVLCKVLLRPRIPVLDTLFFGRKNNRTIAGCLDAFKENKQQQQQQSNNNNKWAKSYWTTTTSLKIIYIYICACLSTLCIQNGRKCIFKELRSLFFFFFFLILIFFFIFIFISFSFLFSFSFFLFFVLNFVLFFVFVFLPEMRLYFDLPPQLMLDAGVLQLNFEQNFQGDDELADLLSRKVNASELSGSQRLSYLETIQRPSLLVLVVVK